MCLEFPFWLRIANQGNRRWRVEETYGSLRSLRKPNGPEKSAEKWSDTGRENFAKVTPFGSD
jgi:hypothetical protein